MDMNLLYHFLQTGCVVQSVSRLSQEPRARARYPVHTLTFVSPSADSRKAVIS